MEQDNFKTVLPPKELRPFVRRYLYANRLLESALSFCAKPTGYTYFSNFFGPHGGEHGIIDGRTFQRKSRWFYYGQIIEHDVTFHHTRALQLIIAEITATGHHRLFGISGRRILGLATSFLEAAPVSELLARECFVLGPDALPAEHVQEANTFFSRLAQNALPGDPVVEETIRLFEVENGAIRIASICEKIGVSPRELNRRFTRIVGMSPKFFGQIMQINWVIGLLYYGDKIKLAEIAQEAGFYDQAHFNRAMQRFFRESPREFLRSDHIAFRAFLANSRHFGPKSTVHDWAAG